MNKILPGISGHSPSWACGFGGALLCQLKTPSPSSTPRTCIQPGPSPVAAGKFIQGCFPPQTFSVMIVVTDTDGRSCRRPLAITVLPVYHNEVNFTWVECAVLGGGWGRTQMLGFPFSYPTELKLGLQIIMGMDVIFCHSEWVTSIKGKWCVFVSDFMTTEMDYAFTIRNLQPSSS